ncbi:kinase-like protein [Cerioporus squamosus]|nr:kinase-like protein [Cerioporus squamosus]
MAAESEHSVPDVQNDIRDAVFEPPEDAIAKILPFLTYERELRILGRSVFANNLFYDMGDGRVVKTGVNVSVNEAKTMMFVRKHTSIPVPEVHMVFQHDGATHIVMERIDGVALREAANHDETGSFNPTGALVTADQVVSIMQELKCFIAELRELGRRFPQQQPQFGSWPDGPFRNSYFYDAFPPRPFHSVDEFHAYFLNRLRPLTEGEATYDLLEKVRRESAESEPVLTHGDLAPRNILIKNGRIVAVVDWETFGWYPDFWEYMGVGNEVMPRVTSRAIEATFGKTSLVCETYRYVHACLTQHDLFYR